MALPWASASPTLAPFLYPSLLRANVRAVRTSFLGRAGRRPERRALLLRASTCCYGSSSSSASPHQSVSFADDVDVDSGAATTSTRLNPSPSDYAHAAFADKALLTVHAGGGGDGCVSFFRDARVADGPPNGGDGGVGGSVYIQAVDVGSGGGSVLAQSLHRLARRRVVRAGKGKNGQGSSMDGRQGDDVVLTVPVGTVVRELTRVDPVQDEVRGYRQARDRMQARAKRLEERRRERREARAQMERERAEVMGVRPREEGEEEYPEEEEEDEEEDELDDEDQEDLEAPFRRKFVFYPGLKKSARRQLEVPQLPRRQRSLAQPSGPVHLDLSHPTPQPILLAAGGLGGLGNTHFGSSSAGGGGGSSRSRNNKASSAGPDTTKPHYATRGDGGVTMTLELELRLLADVGLVGFPNAGKSTLVRALTNSRARVGAWAFTTLHPNVGTVVLDDHRGRPSEAYYLYREAQRAKRERHRGMTADAKYGAVGWLDRGADLVEEDYYGADAEARARAKKVRTRFTIADIPGLVRGAHSDSKGLGAAFLRHVERAGVLCLVVDLSSASSAEPHHRPSPSVAADAAAGEDGSATTTPTTPTPAVDPLGAVDAVKALWAEVGAYARGRAEEERLRLFDGVIDWDGDGESANGGDGNVRGTSSGRRGLLPKPGEQHMPPSNPLGIAAKPWLVVATKADLPETRAAFAELKKYLARVTAGTEPHPSGIAGAWTERCEAVPVSAINGQGVERIVNWIVGLLDQGPGIK